MGMKNKNSRFNNMLKDIDNNYKNNVNQYYHVNDLLFLNKENGKIYRNSGTTTENPSTLTFKRGPIISGNKPTPLLNNYMESEVEKEKVYIEASINNIEDLITMINKYPLDKNIE